MVLLNKIDEDPEIKKKLLKCLEKKINEDSKFFEECLEKRDFILPVHLEAFDLNDAWFSAVEACVKYGHIYHIDSGSYAGQKRKEFDFFTCRITNPGGRPLHILIPEGNTLAAPNDEQYIKDYYERYLRTDIREGGEDYTYGERLTNPKSLEAKTILEIQKLRDELRKTTDKNKQIELSDKITKLHQTGQVIGSNQINQIIEMYKTKGYGTNQATMEIGMPSDLNWGDPPCLRMIDTRVRYGKLHFTVYFRSWDLVGGFPSNLAGLQLLKEYMVSEIGGGIQDGEIFAVSKGLHIYDHQWEYANIRLGKFTKK